MTANNHGEWTPGRGVGAPRPRQMETVMTYAKFALWLALGLAVAPSTSLAKDDVQSLLQRCTSAAETEQLYCIGYVSGISDAMVARTGEGRARAVANGVKMGRRPKLTHHQQPEDQPTRSWRGDTCGDWQDLQRVRPDDCEACAMTEARTMQMKHRMLYTPLAFLLNR